MTNLINIYKPANSQGKPTIVFIHGLDGDIRTTWMANPEVESSLWPVWLGEDTGCPVWLLGYNAATFRSGGHAMAIPAQATAIIEALSVHPEIRQRQLVLVGHSLGGIFIKSILQQGIGRAVERHREVARNIRGIAFVGTPHFGSGLAGITRWLPFLRANPQVDNLTSDNAYLAELNQYFLARHSELHFSVRLFYETEPVWPRGWLGRFLFKGISVVTPMSSDAHVPGEVAIPIQANHISISKPEDRNADIYRSVVAFTKEVMSSDASRQDARAARKSAPSSAEVRFPEEPEPKSIFIGQLHKWTVRRPSRSLRLYVVEPAKYEPNSHKIIFNSVIRGFLAPKQFAVDEYSSPSFSAPPAAFDLITFPEAFLPFDDLVAALGALSAASDFGCIHVGLRPNDQYGHLFSTQQIATLLERLNNLKDLEKGDLRVMNRWFEKQENNKLFNLGCLFSKDQKTGNMRICLYPKMVRSGVENTATHEAFMKEANVLSLVTLVPMDSQHVSLTLQPLLCSDALFLLTDVPGQRPFEGVTHPGDAFGMQTLPDCIDIVTLAACTPQSEQYPPKGTKYRQWHERFRHTFTRLGEDGLYSRHQHAMFVMSNFNEIPGSDPGGLSGAFVPQPPDYQNVPRYIETSAFGRHIDGVKENEWSNPTRPAGVKSHLLSHLAVLSPYAEDTHVLARLLGFTLSNLPRQVNRRSGAAELVDFDLREVRQDDTGEYILGASHS